MTHKSKNEETLMQTREIASEPDESEWNPDGNSDPAVLHASLVVTTRQMVTAVHGRQKKVSGSSL